MKSIGTIISTDISPTTNEFSFSVSEKSSKKGQFVQVEDQSGYIFGFISEIQKSNRYFERAESINEFINSGSTISENFPTNSWEYLVAKVRILGRFESNKFARVFSPPSPGNNVYLAEDTLLQSFLGFDESGLNIGNIQHHKVNVKISINRLLQKHFAILAMSGSGKSHLCSVLTEELLSRKKEDGRVAIIIVDIHGEYAGFSFDPRFGQKTKIVDGNDICVPLRKISPEMFNEWLPDLSIAQKEVLRHTLSSLKKTDTSSFKDLFFAIDTADISKEEVKRALKRSLSEIKRFKIVSKKREIPKLSSDITSGELTILDFSTIDSLRKKQILVSIIARRLFKLRKAKKIPPFLLVIEEAHNFAREKSSEYDAVSRSIIETIAREGRKFGASLCLISQRPVNLSTTALSQCNTHIILRVTNPNDLDHIQASSEGIDSTVAKSISGLKVGEAIVVGEAVNYPIFVSIRNRQSTKREKGLPLSDQAIEFENLKEKKEKGAEAFI